MLKGRNLCSYNFFYIISEVDDYEDELYKREKKKENKKKLVSFICLVYSQINANNLFRSFLLYSDANRKCFASSPRAVPPQ